MNDSREQMTKNDRSTIDSFEKLLPVLLACDLDDEEEVTVACVLCVCVDRLLSLLDVSEFIKHIGTPSSWPARRLSFVVLVDERRFR